MWAAHTKSDEVSGGAPWRASRRGVLWEAATSRFPTSVLLSEASFLAWSAALLIARLSHCWRYCLDTLALILSHPKQASSHFWIQFSLHPRLFLSRLSPGTFPVRKQYLPLLQPRLCTWHASVVGRPGNLLNIPSPWMAVEIVPNFFFFFFPSSFGQK